MKNLNIFFFIFSVFISQSIASEKLLEQIYKEKVAFYNMLDKRYKSNSYDEWRESTKPFIARNAKKLKTLQSDYKNDKAKAYKQLYTEKVASLTHSIKSVKSYSKERLQNNIHYYTKFLHDKETMLKGLTAEYKNYLNPPKAVLKKVETIKISNAKIDTNSKVLLKSSNLSTNVKSSNINVSNKAKASVGFVSLGKNKE